MSFWVAADLFRIGKYSADGYFNLTNSQITKTLISHPTYHVFGGQT